MSYTTTAPTGLSYAISYCVTDADSVAGTFKLLQNDCVTALGPIPNGGNTVYFYRVSETPSSLAPWDTIDDYNAGGSVLLTQNPWDAMNACGGIESAPGDGNVWKDVTSTGCDGPGKDCRFKDKISGLEWTETAASTMNQGQAVAYCQSLNTTKFDGVPVDGADRQWRLPTQKELMSGYEHGIRSASRASWITQAQMDANYFWSSSTLSATLQNALVVTLAYGATGHNARNLAHSVSCVR
jgi:hypothetical protein